MDPKPLFASRTILFNLLTLLTVATAAVGNHSLITDNPTYVGAFAVVAALVNIGLRLVTSTPIK